MVKEIDVALVSNPDVDLLRPSSSENADIDAVHTCKKIYPLVPYVGMFLKQDLTPYEAWSRLKGDIVNSGSEVDCQPIIYWTQVALMRKSGDE